MPTISNSRAQPLVTPSTALFTRARASPWTAACESFSRIATKLPSCCSTRMPLGSGVSSLPFGPCTATTLPSIFTVTPLGSGIGFLPIRDISSALLTFSFVRLPDLTENFPAYTLFARLTSRHYPARSSKNIDSQSSQHARNFGASNIDPATWPRNSFHIRNRGFVVVAVFQVNAQHLVAFVVCCFEIGDVTLFFENAGNLQLQFGSGNIYLLVPRRNRVTDSRQHVCDRIGQPHCFASPQPPVCSGLVYAKPENPRRRIS